MPQWLHYVIPVVGLVLWFLLAFYGIPKLVRKIANNDTIANTLNEWTLNAYVKLEHVLRLERTVIHLQFGSDPEIVVHAWSRWKKPTSVNKIMEATQNQRIR